MKNFKKTGYVAMVCLIFLLSACVEDGDTRKLTREENICHDSTIDARANFILECIKNANPKSDEEPEDWIWKCKQMAEDTYCPAKYVEISQVRRDSWWHDTKRELIGR